MFFEQTTQKHSDYFCTPAFVKVPAATMFYSLQIEKGATRPHDNVIIIEGSTYVSQRLPESKFVELSPSTWCLFLVAGKDINLEKLGYVSDENNGFLPTFIHHHQNPTTACLEENFWKLHPCYPLEGSGAPSCIPPWVDNSVEKGCIDLTVGIPAGACSPSEVVGSSRQCHVSTPSNSIPTDCQAPNDSR